jgi:hypothetical protein
MNFESMSPVAVGLLLITSLTILTSRDWRVSIGALGLQFLGVFVLVAVAWPANLAVVKLIAGWIAGSVLGITYVSVGIVSVEKKIWPTERLFRLFAAFIILLSVMSITPRVAEWVPNLGGYQVAGGLLLVGMGILHHALTENPFHALLSLISVLSGFEILYAAVETSSLVAGLLAVVNLGIALAGSYLLVAPELEESS